MNFQVRILPRILLILFLASSIARANKTPIADEQGMKGFLQEIIDADWAKIKDTATGKNANIKDINSLLSIAGMDNTECARPAVDKTQICIKKTDKKFDIYFWSLKENTVLDILNPTKEDLWPDKSSEAKEISTFVKKLEFKEATTTISDLKPFVDKSMDIELYIRQLIYQIIQQESSVVAANIKKEIIKKLPETQYQILTPDTKSNDPSVPDLQMIFNFKLAGTESDIVVVDLPKQSPPSSEVNIQVVGRSITLTLQKSTSDSNADIILENVLELVYYAQAMRKLEAGPTPAVLTGGFDCKTFDDIFKGKFEIILREFLPNSQLTPLAKESGASYTYKVTYNLAEIMSVECSKQKDFPVDTISITSILKGLKAEPVPKEFKNPTQSFSKSDQFSMEGPVEMMIREWATQLATLHNPGSTTATTV